MIFPQAILEAYPALYLQFQVVDLQLQADLQAEDLQFQVVDHQFPADLQAEDLPDQELDVLQSAALQMAGHLSHALQQSEAVFVLQSAALQMADHLSHALQQGLQFLSDLQPHAQYQDLRLHHAQLHVLPTDLHLVLQPTVLLLQDADMLLERTVHNSLLQIPIL